MKNIVQIVLEQLGMHMKKKKERKERRTKKKFYPLVHLINRNWLEMEDKPKFMSSNYNTTRRKYERKLCDL